MTHHLEGGQRVEFDQAVEPAKQDRRRKEHDVARVAPEQSHQLDCLGEAKYKDDLGPEGLLAADGVPLGGALPQRVDDEGVEKEGQGGEGGDVKRISAPGLLPFLMLAFAGIGAGK